MKSRENSIQRVVHPCQFNAESDHVAIEDAALSGSLDAVIPFAQTCQIHLDVWVYAHLLHLATGDDVIDRNTCPSMAMTADAALVPCDTACLPCLFIPMLATNLRRFSTMLFA